MDTTVYIVDPLGYINVSDTLSREYVEKYYPNGLPKTYITIEPSDDFKKPKWNFELKEWEEGYIKPPPTVSELARENEKLRQQKEMSDMALIELSKSILGGEGGE